MKLDVFIAGACKVIATLAPLDTFSFFSDIGWCFLALNSIEQAGFFMCAAAVVTSKSWDKLISQSDIPVLVEFYASWCGPCRMVHRVIDEIAGDFSGRLKCFVLNTDEDSDIAESYDIKAVPVVFLFKNGKKCESIIGTMPKEFYVAAIERVLSS